MTVLHRRFQKCDGRLNRHVCVCRGKILFLLRLLADHVPGIGLIARKSWSFNLQTGLDPGSGFS